MTPEENPLTFLTMDELWDEIKRRNDFALLVYDTTKSEDDMQVGLFYHGGRIACLGLASFASERLNRSFDEDQKHIEE